MGTTWGDGWHPSASALGMSHTLGKGCRCGENERETCGEIENGIIGVHGDNWKGYKHNSPMQSISRCPLGLQHNVKRGQYKKRMTPGLSHSLPITAEILCVSSLRKWDLELSV